MAISDPRQAYSQLRSRAKRLGVAVLSQDEYLDLISQPCHYCKGALSPFGFGLDRKSPSGDYSLANAVPCCRSCNARKKRMPYDDFREAAPMNPIGPFWLEALGRLEAAERTPAWLAKRLGVSRQAVYLYIRGLRPTPERVRRDVALLLDIRTEKAA